MIKHNKTLLITGGAGYIGSHTAYLLNTHGYNLVVLDNLYHKNTFDHPWATFIRGDFGDAHLLASIFSRYSIEAVMHFAAFIEVGESVKDPQRYYQNNVLKTLQLLQSMLEHKVKKIIFSSSAAVYGNPTTEVIDESHPCNPINPYGHTKKIVETMLQDYSTAYGLKYAALRYFNVGGALVSKNLGEHHLPESHLIPLLIQAAINDKPFTLYGNDYPTHDGTCIRDYLHVMDIAQAHVLALNFLENNSSTMLNLGTGAGYSVKEISQAVSEIIGIPLHITYGARRQGDPAKLVASSTKAHALLGWKPQHTLIDIISSAYKFEKSHKHCQ